MLSKLDNMISKVVKLSFLAVFICILIGFSGCKESFKDSKNVILSHNKKDKGVEAKVTPKDKKKKKEDSSNKVVLYESDADYSLGEIAFVDTLSTEKLEQLAAQAQEQFATMFAYLDEEKNRLGVGSDDQSYKTIFFEPKSTEVNDSQITAFAENITNAAKAAKEGKKVVIRGHGDKLEAEYAEAVAVELAEKRAQLVKNEIIKAGAPANNVEVAALGTTEQLVFNLDFNNQEQNMYNRRVEILTI